MKRTEAKNVGQIIDDLLKKEHLDVALDEHRASALWPQIVGDGINRYTIRRYVNNGVMTVHLSSASLANELTLGGSITFYACAQDASYAAEHFGVAVSTSGNTSASSFTTVQEWTLTAKGGEGGVRSFGREGNDRVQGNWYQYTVDLSAYSGMGYVAIRHFNCHDEFILNVDDITIVEGAGGPGPGPGPNPGSNGLQLPRESEIVWSNCLDKDMYIAPADVTVLLNSADSPEGTVVTFTNYNEAEQQNYPIAPITLDGSGFYAFDSFRRGVFRKTGKWCLDLEQGRGYLARRF